MAASGPLSMQDGLTEIMSAVGRMLMSPGNDKAFLMDLQHVLIAKTEEQPQQGQQDAAPGEGGPPVAGPGGPPGGQPDQGQAGQGGPPGPPQPGQNQLAGQPNSSAGMRRPAPPNPDELRRFLESRAGR